MKGTFVGSNHRGYASFASGSGGCDGGSIMTYTYANMGTCESTTCSISCGEHCNVAVAVGSASSAPHWPHMPDWPKTHMPNWPKMPGSGGKGGPDADVGSS